MSDYKYIKFFEDVRVNDVALVGGKNASLGELLSFGINVPLGFAVTSTAFDYVLDTNYYTIKEKEITLRELISKDIRKISNELKSEDIKA
ncbi:MAG TPA: phosphoenolpyruvate synthase, partial [archaeon]|nr:phosphoenolpyruvate synthase [archaeon]